MSFAIAPAVAFLKGIDVGATHIRECNLRKEKEGISNVEFEERSLYDLESTADYDIVLMSDVIEHVVRQKEALEKALGTLIPGGIIFLTTNNRWWPIEGHKYLPFLTYLPKGLANRYVRVMKRGNEYGGYHLMGYFELRKLLDFLDVDYSFEPPLSPSKPTYRVGAWLVRRSSFFWCLANAFQVIITKRSGYGVVRDR